MSRVVASDVRNARQVLEQLWADVGVETRIHSGNLITITTPELYGLIDRALHNLNSRLAGRHIVGVISPNSRLKLDISLIEQNGSYIERYTLYGSAEQLPGAILPLLAPNTLNYVWWTRMGIPPRGHLFELLAEIADQIIADTLSVHLDSNAHYALADLSWSRTAHWRELTAQLFDPPETAAVLPDICGVKVKYAAGSKGDQAARFYIAWLASRLGWQDLCAAQLVPVSHDYPVGEIVEVELWTSNARFTVSAEAGSCAKLHVELPSGSRNAMVHLEPPSLSWLLAFAMDAPEHNALFEIALKTARKSQMRYQTYAHPQAVGQAAADLFVQLYHESIAARGIFHVALSGGSTPVHLYQALRKKELDWSLVHWYWSDERCVPAHSSQSNYKLAWDELLSHLKLEPSHIHRMEGEMPAAVAARRYCEVLPDTLDLCYLGMGDDGHTASLFPNTEGLQQDSRTIANWVEKLASWRISFSFAEINRSRNVHILAAGAGKAPVLHQVRGSEGNHPVAKVQNPLWLLDEAAAAEL